MNLLRDAYRNIRERPDDPEVSLGIALMWLGAAHVFFGLVILVLSS